MLGVHVWGAPSKSSLHTLKHKRSLFLVFSFSFALLNLFFSSLLHVCLSSFPCFFLFLSFFVLFHNVFSALYHYFVSTSFFGSFSSFLWAFFNFVIPFLLLFVRSLLLFSFSFEPFSFLLTFVFFVSNGNLFIYLCKNSFFSSLFCFLLTIFSLLCSFIYTIYIYVRSSCVLSFHISFIFFLIVNNFLFPSLSLSFVIIFFLYFVLPFFLSFLFFLFFSYSFFLFFFFCIHFLSSLFGFLFDTFLLYSFLPLSFSLFRFFLSAPHLTAFSSRLQWMPDWVWSAVQSLKDQAWKALFTRMSNFPPLGEDLAVQPQAASNHLYVKRNVQASFC